jgi:hypothetical protein
VPTETCSQSPRRSLKALDRFKLTLGNIRDVFEPCLAVFLVTHRWNPAQVGVVTIIPAVSAISLGARWTRPSNDCLGGYSS